MLFALAYAIARFMLEVLIVRRKPDAELSARFVLRDRDSKFSVAFDEIFKGEGVEVIRLPYRRPVANSFAERWEGSARREGPDHLLIFGRRHLQKVLAEFIEHYNQARPHQGLDQREPCPPIGKIIVTDGRVERRDRLGGVLHEYSWTA